ncbi:MAG TPA: ABC transporter substrate-binding protein [Acidimicrobiia bacterium]|nr:ABC transporter substrate-binding protein [Acidimicrobiia bacterium]
MRARTRVATAVIVAVATAAAFVLPAGSATAADSGDRTGVTSTEIRVGGIVGKTNPTGRAYDDAFKGVQAYFDMVNAKGGVFGHKLKIVAQLDDQSQASRNVQGVRSLVEEKKVFAVLPVATIVFAGATYLVQKGVPTFGWNINPEWMKGPNLFGQRGSYTCFDCAQPWLAYVAKQAGAKKAAVLSYTTPSSADCAKGEVATFKKYGIDIGWQDTSLAFGFTDLSTDVQHMKDAGVNFVATCMDVNGNINVGKALKQAGVDGVTIYSPEGYDPAIMKKFAKDLEGYRFGSDFVPFEAAKDSKGMTTFINAMKKKGYKPNELELAGWIDADLLVRGIKASGKNFTRQSVIDNINKITDYTANGILAPVDWTIAHTGDGPLLCTATLEAKSGKFVPILGQPGKPFVCFPNPRPDTVDSPTFR